MNRTASIKLSQGRARVDAEDRKWLSAYTWTNGCQYARRFTRVAEHGKKGKRRGVYMHRAIWEHHNGPIPEGLQIDHIDRDGYNNCKSNLRLATAHQNQGNQRSRGGKSKYRGVTRHNKKWRARLHQGHGKTAKIINLGCYVNEEDAARAYDACAREWFGEFAYVNFDE